MTGYLKRWLVLNLLSPYGMAVVPYCVFMIAWLFPPNLYSFYVREPNMMHLQPVVWLFYTLCVVGFLLGVWAAGVYAPSQPPDSVPKVRVRSLSPFMYLAVPLVIAAALCFMYMMLLGARLNLISMLTSQQGDAVKAANMGGAGGGGSDSGRWAGSLFLMTSVLWWAAYRSSQLKLKGTAKKLFYVIFVPAAGIDIVTCIATFDRTNLMPVVAGLAVIYLFMKTRTPKVKLGRLALTGFGSIFTVLGAFLVLQFTRGASRVDAFITSIMGYTIVSYNHMAAMVLGALHYAYEGRGAYVVAFLTENDRLAGIRGRMNLPTSYGIWLTEFPSVLAAGLNSSYNWAGVFGYIYSDIGWWTPLYMFFAGLLAGFLWSKFKAGHTIALVMYPWLCFWILFWFGWNLLLDARCVMLFESAILLLIYDTVFLRRVREAPALRPVPTPTWGPVGAVVTTHRGGTF
jgi:hypothetical protein